MDPRQLRYSVAVAEERHFGRAARRLRTSQPPLSVQIKALERGLDARLLERTGSRVTLTEAGRAFLERAETVLDVVEEAREVARASDSELRAGSRWVS